MNIYIYTHWTISNYACCVELCWIELRCSVWCNVMQCNAMHCIVMQCMCVSAYVCIRVATYIWVMCWRKCSETNHKLEDIGMVICRCAMVYDCGNVSIVSCQRAARLPQNLIQINNSIHYCDVITPGMLAYNIFIYIYIYIYIKYNILPFTKRNACMYIYMYTFIHTRKYYTIRKEVWD